MLNSYKRLIVYTMEPPLWDEINAHPMEHEKKQKLVDASDAENDTPQKLPTSSPDPHLKKALNLEFDRLRQQLESSRLMLFSLCGFED